MWCPASISASRIVAAKAGVPMKTRSSTVVGRVAYAITRHLHPPARRAGSPLSRSAGEGAERSEAGEGALSGDRDPAALRLGELAQDHSAFDQREVVDKEDAVEVLDLMLQAGGEEPRGVHR